MDAETRFSRWWLVAAAALVMGAAGTYQFVWSSLRGPVGAGIGASEAALGTTFTLFVVFQTVAQFPAGRIRDRRGPRLPIAAAAVLLAAGYAGAALAPSATGLYLAYSVGGVGAGIAYTVAVNTPVKWFSERRGLATGVVAMAYGGASALVIPAVRGGVGADVDATLYALGAGVGLVALASVPVFRDPDEGAGASGRDRAAAASTWRETVRTWQFWLLYAVFVAVNGVGLMVIGKAVAFAEALDLGAGAATGSASLLALADAAGIVVVSGVSDWVGRERTIAGALVLSGGALAAAVAAAGAGLPAGFVALVAAFAFFRSPVFALFPSIVGEYYGEEHSSSNYALLYTAKLWGAALGGAGASGLVLAVGWTPTFLAGAAVLGAAGVAAAFLRPRRRAA